MEIDGKTIISIKPNGNSKVAPIFPTYDCTTDFDDESSYPTMERDADGEYYWRKEADGAIIRQQITVFRARATAARCMAIMFAGLDARQHNSQFNIDGIGYPMEHKNRMLHAYRWNELWFNVHRKCLHYAMSLENLLDTLN